MAEFDPVEQLIIERLLSEMGTDFNVMSFTYDLSAVAKPVARATILIGHKGDRLAAPNRLDPLPRAIAQQRVVSYETIIRFQDLRTNLRVKPFADRIQNALTGFSPSPPPATFMYQVQGGFVPVSDGLLLYAQIFEFSSPYQQLRAV